MKTHIICYLLFFFSSFSLPHLRHPVRTLSFSHDSQFIAAGSEDKFIDIVIFNQYKDIENVHLFYFLFYFNLF